MALPILPTTCPWLEYNMASSEEEPTSISILTLNCWGLKYISKYRSERLGEIGRQLAVQAPPLDIVGLQECWTYVDYASIRESTRHILPYGKFYHSGIFGGGLVILSRWPIEESSMYRYPLNGRPTAFFRGDWFVGKGVACARIRMAGGKLLEVFNTHLHAPYEREPNDSYICHRTAQAWEIAKLMRDAMERGSVVVGLGDFNMVPMSFAHVLIEGRGGGVRDVWRLAKPSSSVGASIDSAESDRRRRLKLKSTPDADESLRDHGHTCDSILNTWRWSKADQKQLRSGKELHSKPSDADPRAKRLDYIFFGGLDKGWKVDQTQVCMTDRHPKLLCSLSDHFAVRATILRSDTLSATPVRIDVDHILRDQDTTHLETELTDIGEKDLEKVLSQRVTSTQITATFYEDILAMIQKYTMRERQQRRLRLSHFVGSAVVSIGCFVAVWWAPGDYVAFVLTLLSSLGLMAGTVDGMIGGLFVGSELRALHEFEWEVRNALRLAGGNAEEERSLRDWYD